MGFAQSQKPSVQLENKTLFDQQKTDINKIFQEKLIDFDCLVDTIETATMPDDNFLSWSLIL